MKGLLRTADWPVTLRHGPVTLRPLRRRDEQAWAEIRERGREWFRPWDSTRPPESNEQSLTWPELVGVFNQRARRGQMLPWAVEYSPPEGGGGPDGGGPRFVGQLTVSGIARGSASWGQVGYWVDPRWAGRGIIPTALAMATDHCFTVLRLHRIEVAIRPENTNSLAVVAKLGFRHEGRRPAYMHVDGAWRDHELFALHTEEVPGGLLARLDQVRASRPRS